MAVINLGDTDDGRIRITVAESADEHVIHASTSVDVTPDEARKVARVLLAKADRHCTCSRGDDTRGPLHADSCPMLLVLNDADVTEHFRHGARDDAEPKPTG